MPFDFERRRVSVFVEKDDERVLIVKGAPEDILRLATSFLDLDGKTCPLGPESRIQLQARFEELCSEGLRTLAVGTRLLNSDHDATQVADEAELAFEGFLVFLDPPKASAAEAIGALAQSGVTVKILTGDNERVASPSVRCVRRPGARPGYGR